LNSGVITADGLTQVFRTLSQKRRHGVLEITSASGQVEVFFHAGRIIGASSVDSPLSTLIARRLHSAQKISEDELNDILEQIPEVERLVIILSAKESITKDDFFQAKRACEMDLLYSVRSLEKGFYNFEQQIVETRDEMMLSISPGQLLLDFVELVSGEERFDKAFSGLHSSDVHLYQNRINGEQFSDGGRDDLCTRIFA